MGTQFINVAMYGKAASKAKATATGTRSFSASDIAAEQMRVDGHTGHVDLPQPPEIIFGIDPRVAVNAAIASFDGEPKSIVQTAKGPRERGVRADTPIVLAGVVSWPDSVEVLTNDEDRRALFEEWKAQNLLWLRKRYGRDLRSVVLHQDESHPHLHFTVASDRAIETRTKHDPSHGTGSAKGAREALRAFQDDYYAGVSIKCGLARVGPKRQRVASRADWLMQKKNNEILAREWQKLGARQQLIEQAEREGDAALASAWDQAERIIAEAMAKATTMAREMVSAAKSESAKLVAAARASLDLLKDGHREVEDTLRRLQGLVPETKLQEADRRVKTRLLLEAVDQPNPPSRGSTPAASAAPSPLQAGGGGAAKRGRAQPSPGRSSPRA
jgi:vacuolar-type H+-ATPase subunit H